jgi:hypothetical protein
VFLDWAEGCITNPLLTFEYFREHLSRHGMQNPAAAEHLAAAYLGPWLSYHSLAELRSALELSPLIAVFAYAVTRDCWYLPEITNRPKIAGYFRALTRRMYRETINAAKRRELCIA